MQSRHLSDSNGGVHEVKLRDNIHLQVRVRPEAHHWKKKQRTVFTSNIDCWRQYITGIMEARAARYIRKPVMSVWRCYLPEWKRRATLCSKGLVILYIFCPLPHPHSPFITDWWSLIQNPQGQIGFRFRMYYQMLESYYMAYILHFISHPKQTLNQYPIIKYSISGGKSMMFSSSWLNKDYT